MNPADDELTDRVWTALLDGEWRSTTWFYRTLGFLTKAANLHQALRELEDANIIEWRKIDRGMEWRATREGIEMKRPSIYECSDDTWIEPYEAALIIGTKEATVIEATKRGHLKGRQVAGGRWQIKAGDARKHAGTRGRKDTREESLPTNGQSARVVETNETRSPTQNPNSLREVISKARAELKVIDEQLTILQTRKAELTEVMTAAETVNRYLTVAP